MAANLARFGRARGAARKVLTLLLATTMLSPALALAQGQGAKTGVDIDKWSPEYVRSIAGTEKVNTAEECAEIVPQDYEGRVSFWYVGPTEAEPAILKEKYAEFFQAFGEAYPNIEVDAQSLGYNDMLNKIRTAALGNAAPMVARMPILWGIEFASKGQLEPLSPEDVGYSVEDFWPGAMKSITLDGETYGIPTNNETMALVYNAGIFEAAGLDPNTPPESWDDVVEYSRQIREKTGKAGYGMVARVNAGNTPFRFMPQIWAEGGGALDEAEPNPIYEEIQIDSEGTKRALQQAYDMYVRDKSVPVSALTNTQTENQDPFLANQLAMMIAHPSEYVVMRDRAAQATGSDREAAEEVVDNMRYALIPRGAERRAAVFGGSNIHIFADDVVDGGLDKQAALALVCYATGPEWSTKLQWTTSNPGNLRGFRTEWNVERLDSTPFLDVSTAMLPYGIPFPVIAESPEIMNIIVPEMLQNVLTERMTIDEAVADARRKIESLRDGL